MFYPDLPLRLTCFSACLNFGTNCEAVLGRSRKLINACNQVGGRCISLVYQCVPRIVLRLCVNRGHCAHNGVLTEICNASCANTAILLYSSSPATHSPLPITQVLSSNNLAKLLQRMLQVGNIMNEGTRRGGASGFTLDSLLKMVNTKGTLVAVLFMLCVDGGVV